MSKAVYVVIRHIPYEDGEIQGVYDNRELAELAAAIFQGSDMEEYELNAHEDKIRSGVRGWWLQFSSNGDAHCCNTISGLVDADEITAKPPSFVNENAPEPVMNVIVMAKDEEEAVMKARAKRSEFLASRPGSGA